MRATTTQGREIDLKQDTFDGLKMRLRGPVFLLPGDVGYEESRTVWNAMIDRKPAAVARCLGSADVIAGVQFARDNDILLCIKGGGHNIAGLATADGALMLDLSLMRGVWVNPQSKVAHAQAGCLLGDVDRETQVHGLAAVLGFISLTGIAGLTLGGGFGYLTRRWGWTSDTVVGMDVVTTDARLVRASSDENADLFWGLRGGGGNFGVVTGIDYKLYPVGPESVSPDVVELAGADALIARARAHLDSGRPLQAIHLAEIVLHTDAADPGCRAVLKDAHTALLADSVNFWESAWLTAAITRYS